MKALQIVLVLSFSQVLLAQPSVEMKVNRFTVLGSVELKEMADQASLFFTIKGVGSILRQAVENAEKKTKTLSDRLKVLGIKERNLSTSQFFSGENLGDKAFLSSSRDYRATITTLVTIDSLQLLQPTIFMISEAEVENMSEITFSLKDEVAFRRRARIEAVVKAKEKAEDIARALGVSIGKVILIDELPTQTQFTNNAIFLRGGRSGPNPFNPVTVLNEGTVDESKGSGFFAQTISVTSQIQVTFEIK